MYTTFDGCSTVFSTVFSGTIDFFSFWYSSSCTVCRSFFRLLSTRFIVFAPIYNKNINEPSMDRCRSGPSMARYRSGPQCCQFSYFVARSSYFCTFPSYKNCLLASFPYPRTFHTATHLCSRFFVVRVICRHSATFSFEVISLQYLSSSIFLHSF